MIKAKRVQDVRDILKAQGFSEWYLRYETLHSDLLELRIQDPDLLTHTVLRAGEFEDRAHQAENTYASLDGSFETLSDYEQQRAATSYAWEDLGRAEYQLAEHRQAASELRAKLTASRKDEQTPAVKAEEARLEAELNVEERLVEEWDKQVQEARSRFDESTAQRDELWRVVEEAWLRAFRANMARIEYAFLGKRARADQEAMSRAEQTNEADSAESIEAEEARMAGELAALLEQAEADFECVAIAEFLYWPHQDDMRAALCVPLVGDMNYLNIQVTKLQIFRVERAKGLKFIEPLPEGAEAEDNDGNRLDAFFIDRPR